MGIVRSRLHKRKVTGGKTRICRKRRKHELGRLPANTKLGSRRVAPLRARGGNFKVRGLRLESGNFAWGTEAMAHRARILDVVYNASSNELVRTKTLVKNCIVTVDASPFKVWFSKRYGIDYDAQRRAGAKKTEKDDTKAKVKAKVKRTDEVKPFDTSKASSKLVAKWAARTSVHKVEKAIEDQIKLGRILCRLTSRPGQTGRADGALLEGAELQFYMKKLEKKK